MRKLFRKRAAVDNGLIVELVAALIVLGISLFFFRAMTRGVDYLPDQVCKFANTVEASSWTTRVFEGIGGVKNFLCKKRYRVIDVKDFCGPIGKYSKCNCAVFDKEWERECKSDLGRLKTEPELKLKWERRWAANQVMELVKRTWIKGLKGGETIDSFDSFTFRIKGFSDSEITECVKWGYTCETSCSSDQTRMDEPSDPDKARQYSCDINSRSTGVCCAQKSPPYPLEQTVPRFCASSDLVCLEGAEIDKVPWRELNYQRGDYRVKIGYKPVIKIIDRPDPDHAVAEIKLRITVQIPQSMRNSPITPTLPSPYPTLEFEIKNQDLRIVNPIYSNLNLFLNNLNTISLSDFNSQNWIVHFFQPFNCDGTVCKREDIEVSIRTDPFEVNFGSEQNVNAPADGTNDYVVLVATLREAAAGTPIAPVSTTTCTLSRDDCYSQSEFRKLIDEDSTTTGTALSELPINQECFVFLEETSDDVYNINRGRGICTQEKLSCKIDSNTNLPALTILSANPPDSRGELCGNRLDDNCDGVTDAIYVYRDFDRDGYGTQPSVFLYTNDPTTGSKPDNPLGAEEVETICIGDQFNFDVSDALGGIKHYIRLPLNPADIDCNDEPGFSQIFELSDGTTQTVRAQDIHPGATELCDGVDNDCDSRTLDAASATCPATTTTCEGVRVCNNGVWDACEAPARNLCLGCSVLPHSLGVNCRTNLPGECGFGTYICDGEENVRCEPEYQINQQRERCDLKGTAEGNLRDYDCDGIPISRDSDCVNQFEDAFRNIADFFDACALASLPSGSGECLCNYNDWAGRVAGLTSNQNWQTIYSPDGPAQRDVVVLIDSAGLPAEQIPGVLNPSQTVIVGRVQLSLREVDSATNSLVSPNFEPTPRIVPPISEGGYFSVFRGVETDLIYSLGERFADSGLNVNANREMWLRFRENPNKPQTAFFGSSVSGNIRECEDLQVYKSKNIQLNPEARGNPANYVVSFCGFNRVRGFVFPVTIPMCVYGEETAPQQPELQAISSIPGEIVLGDTLRFSLKADRVHQLPVTYYILGYPQGITQDDALWEISLSDRSVANFGITPREIGDYELLIGVTDARGLSSAPFAVRFSVVAPTAPPEQPPQSPLQTPLAITIDPEIPAQMTAGQSYGPYVLTLEGFGEAVQFVPNIQQVPAGASSDFMRLEQSGQSASLSFRSAYAGNYGINIVSSSQAGQELASKQILFSVCFGAGTACSESGACCSGTCSLVNNQCTAGSSQTPSPQNSVPSITTVEASSTTAGEEITFTATASDRDGDSIQLRWSFDGGITWTPFRSPGVFTEPYAFSSGGSKTIKVDPRDSRDNVGEQFIYQINILELQPAPSDCRPLACSQIVAGQGNENPITQGSRLFNDGCESTVCCPDRPESGEGCYDGTDNDCDGFTDYDGFTSGFAQLSSSIGDTMCPVGLSREAGERIRALDTSYNPTSEIEEGEEFVLECPVDPSTSGGLVRSIKASVDGVECEDGDNDHSDGHYFIGWFREGDGVDWESMNAQRGVGAFGENDYSFEDYGMERLEYRFARFRCTAPDADSNMNKQVSCYVDRSVSSAVSDKERLNAQISIRDSAAVPPSTIIQPEPPTQETQTYLFQPFTEDVRKIEAFIGDCAASTGQNCLCRYDQWAQVGGLPTQVFSSFADSTFSDDIKNSLFNAVRVRLEATTQAVFIGLEDNGQAITNPQVQDFVQNLPQLTEISYPRLIYAASALTTIKFSKFTTNNLQRDLANTNGYGVAYIRPNVAGGYFMFASPSSVGFMNDNNMNRFRQAQEQCSTLAIYKRDDRAGTVEVHEDKVLLCAQGKRNANIPGDACQLSNSYQPLQATPPMAQLPLQPSPQQMQTLTRDLSGFVRDLENFNTFLSDCIQDNVNDGCICDYSTWARNAENRLAPLPEQPFSSLNMLEEDIREKIVDGFYLQVEAVEQGRARGLGIMPIPSNELLGLSEYLQKQSLINDIFTLPIPNSEGFVRITDTQRRINIAKNVNSRYSNEFADGVLIRLQDAGSIILEIIKNGNSESASCSSFAILGSPQGKYFIDCSGDILEDRLYCTTNSYIPPTPTSQVLSDGEINRIVAQINSLDELNDQIARLVGSGTPSLVVQILPNPQNYPEESVQAISEADIPPRLLGEIFRFIALDSEVLERVSRINVYRGREDTLAFAGEGLHIDEIFVNIATEGARNVDSYIMAHEFEHVKDTQIASRELPLLANQQVSQGGAQRQKRLMELYNDIGIEMAKDISTDPSYFAILDRVRRTIIPRGLNQVGLSTKQLCAIDQLVLQPQTSLQIARTTREAERIERLLQKNFENSDGGVSDLFNLGRDATTVNNLLVDYYHYNPPQLGELPAVPRDELVRIARDNYGIPTIDSPLYPLFDEKRSLECTDDRVSPITFTVSEDIENLFGNLPYYFIELPATWAEQDASLRREKAFSSENPNVKDYNFRLAQIAYDAGKISEEEYMYITGCERREEPYSCVRCREYKLLCEEGQVV